MQSLLSRLIPFIFLGVMIVLLVIGIIALSYLLMVGALVGLVLFVVAWLKEKFSKKDTQQTSSLNHKPGRTIDHNDL